MMIIANPIYDIVFKYLMANLEIAKGVISTIINEDILMLDFKSQEHIHKFKRTDLNETETGDDGDINVKELTYYHLDFIARIKLSTGGYKNVLIELQKTNLPPDIMRFRRYLGDQYKKEDEIQDEDGAVSKEGLPIITIYFLGYIISDTLPGVIKVNRDYIDVLGGGKKIEERCYFIECLTHNSYVIQIPSLHVELKTELERVLSVFQQENFIEGTSRLKKYDHEPASELQLLILKQLQKAAGDSELLKQVEEEENARHEYEYTYRALVKDVARKKRELENMNRELENKGKELENKDKELENKHKELENKHKELENKHKELENKDKELENKDKELDQNKKILDEKEKYIQELLEKLKAKEMAATTDVE